MGNTLGTSAPRPSTSGSGPSTPTARLIPNSPAPIDWVHFEGRSVKTTLSNIMGLDGLARERKWRSHCVFSVDVGRRARQGVEAVRPVLHFHNEHATGRTSPLCADLYPCDCGCGHGTNPHVYSDTFHPPIACARAILEHVLVLSNRPLTSLLRTHIAHTACGRTLPQPALRACALAPIRVLPARVPPLPHRDRACACTAHRPLG